MEQNCFELRGKDMNRNEIMNILPHRENMLLLDVLLQVIMPMEVLKNVMVEQYAQKVLYHWIHLHSQIIGLKILAEPYMLVKLNL